MEPLHTQFTSSGIYSEDDVEFQTPSSTLATPPNASPNASQQLPLTNESLKASSSTLALCRCPALFTQSSSECESATVWDDEHNVLMAESWSAPTYTESEYSKITTSECDRTCMDIGANDEITNSGCESVTLWDEGHEAIMAESWSEPTYNENADEAMGEISGLADAAFTKYNEYSPKNEGRLLGLPIYDSPTDSLNPKHLSNIIKSKDTIPHHIMCHSMNRLLLDSGSAQPWNVYNFRLPKIICAFCGMSFTGSNREEEVVHHVRIVHTSGLSDHKIASRFSTGNLPMTHSNTAPIHAAKGPFYRPGSVNHRPEKGSARLGVLPKRQDIHFAATGAWAAKSSLTIASNHQPRLIACDNTQIPHDQLLFLLNNLNPETYPERANDFFNGLELIIGNLLERFPNDALVRGMRNALARLERLYQLNFGQSASYFDQWASVTTPANSKTSTPSQAHEQTPSQIPPNSINTGEQGIDDKAKTNSKSDNNEGNGSDRLQNVLSKADRNNNREDKPRLLACPIRKHDEAHGNTLSCSFKGMASLSDITTHLRNSRNHRARFLTLSLCRHCYEYVLGQEEYENIHRSKHCPKRPQPRGSRVPSAWLSLYEKIFPHSERIPSPYIDIHTWRLKIQNQDSNLMDIHSPEIDDFNFNNFAGPQSFLDQDQAIAHSEPPLIPETHYQYPDLTEEEGEAVGFQLLSQMGGQHVHQPFDLMDHFMTDLINSRGQMSEMEFNSYADGYRAGLHAAYPILQAQASASSSYTATPAPHSTTLINASNTSFSHILEPGHRWISHFPIPYEMQYTAESTQTALQEDWDPLMFAPPIPLNADVPTFYPDLDLAQILRQTPIFSTEELQPIIPV